MFQLSFVYRFFFFACLQRSEIYSWIHHPKSVVLSNTSKSYHTVLTKKGSGVCCEGGCVLDSDQGAQQEHDRVFHHHIRTVRSSSIQLTINILTYFRLYGSASRSWMKLKNNRRKTHFFISFKLMYSVFGLHLQMNIDYQQKCILIIWVKRVN